MSAPAAEGTEKLLDCNLVMKGGVTSGVVYPAAIQVLRRRFRFRSIGGASAGAIAAAVTAAAEYARQHPPASAHRKIPPGFPGLSEVEKELGEPTFFQDRFVPEPACRGLLKAFLKGLDVLGGAAAAPPPPPTSPPWVREKEARKPSLRGTWKLLRALLAVPWRLAIGLRIVFAGAPLAALFGFGLALFLLYPFAPQDWTAPSMARFFLTALAGLLLGGLFTGGGWLVVVALRLEQKLELGFGICSGKTRPGAAKPALTDWLHERLNQLAGLDPAGPSPTLKQLAQGGVAVKVMTTNLTLAQPMVLPAQRGGRSFFFRREEMERLFPAPVVEQLVAYAKGHRPTRLQFKDGERDELLRFPLGDEIPLLVATRMSLSFPVLLSAVRLYSLRDEAYQRSSQGGLVDLSTDVEEHWFSDGGIANNFPIHVFDSWVPDRPTLGITLYDSPVSQVLAQQERLSRPSPEVDLPDPASFKRARPPRFAINGLRDFLGAIFNTARSYRDTLQSSLPSYRERIAQVFLKPDEGGLNLNMTPATVKRIVQKGSEAGERLVERYAGPLPPDGSAPRYGPSFREHLWVRLYVLFEQFETELAQILAQGPSDAMRKNLFDLMDAQAATPAGGALSWYLSNPTPEWCEQAKERAGAFLDLLERHRGASPLFSAHPPSPRGVLRVTPEV